MPRGIYQRNRSDALAKHFRKIEPQIVADLVAAELTIAELKNKYSTGDHRLREIADSHGIDLRDRAIKMRKAGKLSKSKRNAAECIKKLKTTNRSASDIARDLKISQDAVAAVAKNNGIDLVERAQAIAEIKRHGSRQKWLDSEFIDESLSGDGMSLDWLRKPIIGARHE